MNDSPWNPAIVGTCRVCGAPVETSTDGIRADVACSQDGGHHWWESQPARAEPRVVVPRKARAAKTPEPHP